MLFTVLIRRIWHLMMFLWHLPGAFALTLVTYCPGASGNTLRRLYYRPRLRRLGRNSIIEAGVFIENPQYVSIGDNSLIDRFVSIVAGPVHTGRRKVLFKNNPQFDRATGEVAIGDNVHIAPFAYLMGTGGIAIHERCGVTSGARLFSASHHYGDPTDPTGTARYSIGQAIPEDEQILVVGPLVICRESLVGLNTIVLPGVTIGEGTWVGAMSLVTRSLPSDVIAGGAPASVLKTRYSDARHPSVCAPISH